MAKRLLLAGFPLTVYNRTANKAAILVSQGAVWAESPRKAAENADILISMVSDDASSRTIWLGERGALAAAKSGAAVVESSTVTVGWVRELNSAAQAKGCRFLDAPVTGSKPQAAAGELKFLVGGDAATLAVVRPVFEAMGSRVAHIGPVASGARLKLINNFLVGVQVASLAQAIAMIERGGLDGSSAMEIILAGAAGSPMVKGLAARIAAGDQTLNFPLKLMAKDLDYARQEAAALGLDLATAEAAQSVFQAAVEHGDGDRDLSAVITQFRDAGRPIPERPVEEV